MTTFGVLCLLALAAFPLAHAQSSAPPATPAAAPSYSTNPKYLEAMREGRLQMLQNHPTFAKDAFNKASKIAGGESAPCLRELYQAQLAEQDYKGAIVSAGRLKELATSPAGKSVAEYELGNALLLKGGSKPKPEQLQAAHDALQQALADYPNNVAALFLDGRVLAHMGKMDEASAAFAKCASCASPSDPGRLRASHFAQDPSLSLKPMAPAFAVNTLDGQHFNLDAMRGRVVLIDFWATWCGPCNEELPHMKKIAKEFAGEPLVILSVSWDDDDAKWKDFIRKNEMTWPQYRDADKALTHAFGVEAIPHYFTIDSDGVLTAEMLGEGSNVEGRLKKLLAQAREAQKQMAASSQGGGR